MLHKTEGILLYSIVEIGHKVSLEIDQGIVDFYRSLIPKYYYAKPQKYKAHISVLRYETPKMNWGLHQGKVVQFFYESKIHKNASYFWLNAFSKELEEIRLEMGLEVHSKYTIPPDGFKKCFHITLANIKE